MDNLDLISDQELRHRLMEYGFPNLPVTSTSRKILIKKLRNYMTNEKQKLRRDTSHLSRYSSDEEASDRESTSTTTTTTGRRYNNRATTIGTMSLSTSPTTSHQYNISPIHQKNSMPPPPPAAASILTRRTTTTAAKRITSPPKVQSRNSVYVSSVHRSESDTDESDYPINGQQSDAINSTFLSQNSSERYSPNSKRRQLTMSGGIGENHSYGFVSSPSSSFARSYNGSQLSNSATTSMINNHPASNIDNSPFMSDFTRRLLNLREATVAESSRKSTFIYNYIFSIQQNII